jgi:hypothetical protein
MTRFFAQVLTFLIFGIACFAFLFVLPTGAASAGEAIDEAGKLTGGPMIALPSRSVLQVIGQFHIVAAYLPIALLSFLFLFEMVLFIKKMDTSGGWGLKLSIAACASFIPAASLGLIRAHELFSKRPEPHSFILHRNLMAASFAVVLLSLALRIIKQDELTGKIRSVYLKALFLGLLLCVFGIQR